MKQLLEPDQLQATLSANDCLLVQVSSPESYQQGHIPGAVLVTPRQLVRAEPPATGKLPEIEQLNALFGGLGYHPGLTIIAYDDEGGGWAGRFLWTLDVIGHRDWYYLNGGLHAWHQGDGAWQTQAQHRDATRVSLEIDRGPIAEADDILECLASRAEVRIWDCRSADEYQGRKLAARRGGHIPGAINLDWLELMDPSRGLRLRDDLEALLAARAITRDKPVIAHCQSHHRSGLAYLAVRLLDFPAPRAYPGSWSEWGNRDDTPIATGPSG